MDNDDKSLVRTLFKKGNSLEDIAKKRSVTVEEVEEVLALYKTKGKKAVKEKDLLQGAFWYYQHRTWVLDGEDFAIYNAIVRRVGEDYPFYIQWMQGKYKQDSGEETEETGWVTEETSWKEVREKYEAEAEAYADDSNNNSLEANINHKGADLVPVEDEERILSSVCSISLGEEMCDGTLLTIKGNVGILTSSKLLNDEKSCQKAEVKFETFDDDFDVTLKPETARYNKELNIMFVGCDFPDNFNITPIEKFQLTVEAEEKAVCNSVFFKKGEKVLTTFTVEDVDKDANHIVLNKSITAVGAPIFISASLAGLIMDQNSRALGFDSINKWLDNELDLKFEVDDKVNAKWTDGHSYPATVLEQTENGYLVWFHEYGEGDENKIEVKVSDLELVTRYSKKEKQAIGLLKELKMEKHEKVFRDNNLLNVDVLLEMQRNATLKTKLKEVGIGHGLILKIEKKLSDVNTYMNPVESKSKKIKEVLNEPESVDFEPDEEQGQLNLNEQFKDSNGKISIRKSVEKIAKGEIEPKNVSPENPNFYLKSTNHGRYFKITIVYEEDK